MLLLTIFEKGMDWKGDLPSMPPQSWNEPTLRSTVARPVCHAMENNSRGPACNYRVEITIYHIVVEHVQKQSLHELEQATRSCCNTYEAINDQQMAEQSLRVKIQRNVSNINSKLHISEQTGACDGIRTPCLHKHRYASTFTDA